MPLPLQVTLSLLLVVVVLWFMWRIPRRSDASFDLSPVLAMMSTWTGLTALVCSVAIWFVRRPDPLIAMSFMFLDPGAIGTGTLVLWIYRRYETSEQTVELQVLQAKVGLTLGMLSVILGYLFVFLHKPI